MTLLLSWIGVTDYQAWKCDKAKREGPLLAIARHVQANEVVILWDDGGKAPLSESTEYGHWLEQQLRGDGHSPRICIRPCLESAIMDFAWVYRQLETLREDLDLRNKPACVNASSGTWAMSACWIVFKKACGLNLQLFHSSPEKGVERVELPPNLTIDMVEVMQGRRSALFDSFVRGEIRLNLEGFEDIIGQSESMKAALIDMQVIARFNDVPLLLFGPPGSGKTRLAELIHKSSRNKGEFITVDCGTLGDKQSLAEIWGWERGAFTGADSKKEGLITKAANGTFFLDEVGNADLLTQKNLLRLLQNKIYRPLGGEEKSIETRVIAATNSDLREEVRKRRFRQDLLDRLSVYVIDIPRLCDRREDIVHLARDFIRKFNCDHGKEIEELGGACKVLSDAAERELQRYDWPGNVRELQNVLTRLAVHTLSRKTEITPEDVRRILSVGASSQSALLGMEPLTDGFQLERALDRVRYYYVQEARKKSKNTSETARLLGYDNRTPLRTILKNLKEAGFRIDD